MRHDDATPPEPTETRTARAPEWSPEWAFERDAGLIVGPEPEPEPEPVPTSSSPRSAVLTGLLIVGVALAGLALGAVGNHLLATELHVRAWNAWSAADDRYLEAVGEHRRETDRGGWAVDRGQELRAALVADLVRETDAASLEQDLADLDRSIAVEIDGPEASDDGLTDPETFAYPWERYADVLRIGALVPELPDLASTRFAAAADELAEGREHVQADIDGVLEGARELAAAQLDAYPQATNRTRLDLQHVLEGEPSDGLVLLTDLAAAVEAVRASHGAEAARRAEPSYAVRGGIEEFATSLSNGVPLDFAWAYEVAGRPSDGWYAGTAQFFEDGDEWSLITLTFSIADSWGDRDAEAVVVHEVGHTQVTRDVCRAIFDGPEFAGTDHEMWATAWAIGMGYDTDGAGIQAYGRPSDAQIAAAAGCR